MTNNEGAKMRLLIVCALSAALLTLTAGTTSARAGCAWCPTDPLATQLPPPPAGVALCEGHGGGDGVDTYTETIYVRGGTAIIETGVICPDGTKVPTSLDIAPAVDPGLNLLPIDDGSSDSYAAPGGDDYCQSVWDPSC